MPLSATSNGEDGELRMEDGAEVFAILNLSSSIFAAKRSVVARSTLKFFKLRLLTPMRLGANFHCAFQFRLVMHFHQRGQTRIRCQRVKSLQPRVIENGDDEQNGVRAPLDGFENLPLINDEILAQQRQLHRGADLPEMIQRPLEKLLVGQNRQDNLRLPPRIPSQCGPDRNPGKSPPLTATLF